MQPRPSAETSRPCHPSFRFGSEITVESYVTVSRRSGAGYGAKGRRRSRSQDVFPKHESSETVAAAGVEKGCPGRKRRQKERDEIGRVKTLPSRTVARRENSRPSHL